MKEKSNGYKANLAEEDGIGSGGLWPSDLLHCDDNNLVRSGVCAYYDDGDCNDGDELYRSCSFSDI